MNGGAHRHRPMRGVSPLTVTAIALLVGAVIVTLTMHIQEQATQRAVVVANAAAQRADSLAGSVLQQCQAGQLSGSPCEAAASVKADPVVTNPQAAIGTTAPTVTVTATELPPPVTVTSTPPPVSSTATVTSTTTATPPPRPTATVTRTATPPPPVTSTVTQTVVPPLTTTTTAPTSTVTEPPATTTIIPPPSTTTVSPQPPTMTDQTPPGTADVPPTLPIPNLFGPVLGF